MGNTKFLISKRKLLEAFRGEKGDATTAIINNVVNNIISNAGSQFPLGQIVSRLHVTDRLRIPNADDAITTGEFNSVYSSYCAVQYISGAWTYSAEGGGTFAVGDHWTDPSMLGGGGRIVWNDVNIPAGATVSHAYLYVTAKTTKTKDDVNSYITGEKQLSAATVTNMTQYATVRGTVVGGANNNYITTAQVAWDAIPDWTLETVYTSPDIATVIQEIINQSGWASGNSIALFWDDHNDRSTHSSNTYRDATSFRLDVTYSVLNTESIWIESTDFHFVDSTKIEQIAVTESDVDDTPVDGVTTAPISSNWAYDHVAAADPHTGYVLESLFDANTMLYATTDNTPAALTIAASTFVGRKATGNISAMTAAESMAVLSGAATAAFSFNSQTVSMGHLGIVTAVDTTMGLAYAETYTLTDNIEKWGVYSAPEAQKTTATYTGAIYGFDAQAGLGAGNTQNWTTNPSLIGIRGYPYTRDSSTGTISGMASFLADASIANAATITNYYGFYVGNAGVTGGKLTNAYGIYLEVITAGATLNYAIYSAGGLVYLAGATTFGNNITLTGNLTGGSTTVIASGSTNTQYLALSANDTEFIRFTTAATDVCQLMGTIDGNSQEIAKLNKLGVSTAASVPVDNYFVVGRTITDPAVAYQMNYTNLGLALTAGDNAFGQDALTGRLTIDESSVNGNYTNTANGLTAIRGHISAGLPDSGSYTIARANVYTTIASVAANSTITNLYMHHIENPTGAGVVTNAYGIFIESITKGATLNYAIYATGGLTYLGGAVTLGSTLALGGAVDCNSNNFTEMGTINTHTIPSGTDTFCLLAASQELDGKTLDSSVGKGTWTASGTWTLPAVTAGGNITLASALDLVIASATAAAFEISDGTNKFFAVDTRIANSGVYVTQIQARNPTFASAAGNQFTALALRDYTLTLTGTTGVTHLKGLGLNVDNTLVTDTSAVTVAIASTVYIDGAPTQGGSVTITTPYSLYVNAGVAYFGGGLRFGTYAAGAATDSTGYITITDAGGTSRKLMVQA